jgi:AraC-like DNA-binding protein
MDYREFTPPPKLTPFVDCFWTLVGHSSDLEAAAQPILPDGRPELVIHLGDAFERLEATGAAVIQPTLLLAGQLTGQLTLRPTGAVAVVGVRFHPFGVVGVLKIPQHRLTGHILGVADLSRSLEQSLRPVQGQTDDPARALPLVARALESCLRPATSIDPRLRFVSDRIRDAGGLVSIDALAERISMSRRHLERRFLETVGISPKRLARITRFQNALRVLEAANPRQRGTVTATTCGYADQSHFIREFRELAGCSPTEHVLRRGELTGFFVTARVCLVD